MLGEKQSIGDVFRFVYDCAWRARPVLAWLLLAGVLEAPCGVPGALAVRYDLGASALGAMTWNRYMIEWYVGDARGHRRR